MAGKRISNAELEFLENNIAGAIRINQMTNIAANLTDDLETLELLNDISVTAEKIRTTTINWMHSKKEKSCPNK